ncbi:protein phosphatase 2C domain-containing protein [Streptococcus suis]|uniref:protein phosphatase 2C domain-containing protein n=1 Tax=Streptococcus suis TaxID=1307 RepID=UPI000C18A771|nr:protein phosphatase 2C domain-containing protein [Streptococcus suis]
MIFTYGVSIQGEDHKHWKTPCQDAHCIETLSNGWTIAAIADGVGSAAHSEKGAQLAVETVVSFCIDNMPFTSGIISAENDLIPLLRVAYNKAYKNIWELANSEGNPFETYDTTLDVVIYNGNNIVFGHCSDGGIIALNDSGYYDCVTDRMKGPDGESMIPLRSRKDWQFGIYSNSSSSILLFTDGIYDFARQDFLEKNWKHALYIPLLQKLSNTNSLPKNPSDWTNYLEQFMSEKFWDKYVTDDKTMVVLINQNKESTQVESSYYEEPDWETIMAQVNNQLYQPIDKELTPRDHSEKKELQEIVRDRNEQFHSQDSTAMDDTLQKKATDHPTRKNTDGTAIPTPNKIVSPETHREPSSTMAESLDSSTGPNTKRTRLTRKKTIFDSISGFFKGE